MRRQQHARILPIALLLFLAGMFPELGAGSEETGDLALFQLIARAELVVHVKIIEGSLKYAMVEVLEPIKGEPPAPRLRIAFRDLNWRRPTGVEPIVFPSGQEEILFLTPFRQGRPKPKNRDLYELFHGAEGRLPLPAEGAAATVAAVKQLASLTAIDPVSQADGLWNLAIGENPRLQEAALDELLRLRASGAGRLPVLVGLLRNPSPGLRSRCLRLVGQTFASSLQGEVAPDDLRSALESVLERARNDPDETVRVSAVIAVATWPQRSDVEGDLRAIAAQDTAQMVRYEAERALLTRRLR